MKFEHAYHHDFSDFEDYLLSGRHLRIERKKGERFSSLGENFHYYYYLLSGTAQSSFIHESGNIRTSFFTFKEGAIFPLYAPDSVVEEEENYDFFATSDCVALAFERSAMDACIQENPDFNRAMYACYFQMVSNLNKEIADQIYLRGIENMCRLFYLMVQESGSVLPVTQDELASYLGLNRSNIARCLKQLREEGVVETKRNRIIIKNTKKLREYGYKNRNKA